MIDIFAVREILSSVSRAECGISIEPHSVQIIFAAPAKIIGREEPITVHYKRVLSHKVFNQMNNNDFLNLARESRHRIENKIMLQEAGKNQSKCCNAALNSRGWHHDCVCPNYVVPF